MSAQVTSFQDLKKYSQGSLVTFPAFAEGQPFVARVKRPSLISMMAKGKIPNGLKVRANELFQGGGSALDVDNEAMLTELFDILDIFAEATLIEPTYAQIKEAGLELTDDQLMFIFSYSQNGVKSLENFREEQGNIEPDIDVEDIHPTT